MQNIYKQLLLFLGLLFTEVLPKSGLTFHPGPDRFGDQLMAYIRGKWIAKIKKLSFYIPENPTWQGLKMQTHEPIINPQTTNEFFQYKNIKKTTEIKTIKTKNTLFITDFNVEISKIRSFDDFYYTLKKDLLFCQEIKKMISPIHPIEIVNLPENCINIAVHVRKGGSFDPPLRSENKNENLSTKSIYADKIWPTKFPPDQFYINSLKEIIRTHPNKIYYVHIFTDDANPKRIAKKFKQSLKKTIKFGYRKQGNCDTAYIIDDLINMARFDILIRPQSSFSRVAQLIGEHEFIISPLKAQWKNDNLIITKISRVKKHKLT